MLKQKIVTLSLAFIFVCLILSPVAALETEGTSAKERFLSFVTSDNRPISVDRLLYMALKDIGYQTSFTPFALKTGYEAANNGEKDGVIASAPGIEDFYPNLRKVPVSLEQAGVYAYLRADSELQIEQWDDLSGLNVGVMSQRDYDLSQIPTGATMSEKDTDKALLEDLVDGVCDVAIIMQRSHQEFNPPVGVVRGGELETLEEYLYLNKKYERLIPEITDALNSILEDGRGHDILNDMPAYEHVPNKTVLHIISSNSEIDREDHFYARLKEQTRDFQIEWYSVALNSRRFPAALDRQSSVARLLRQDCVSRDIAAIMVSGKDALQFLSEHYLLFFRNVPVLYYGIDNDYEQEIRDFKAQFTGVLETLSVAETASLALSLFPQTENILVVNDYTNEGAGYREVAEEQLKPFADSVNIRYNENTDREELLEQIRNLPSDSLVLFGSYFRDAKGQYYPKNEMTRALEENCHVPVFTLYSVYGGYNAIGGKCPDYELFGNVASDMLGKLLDGRNPESIPLISDASGYNRWIFDKNVMDKWGISEEDIPHDALILNKMPSIWESDPRFAITLIGLLVSGIVVIIVATVFYSKFRKQKELIEKETKIREVKERLERIIETSPISFLISVDGKVAGINESMKREVGLEVGSSIREVYLDLNESDRLSERVMLEGVVKNHVTRIVHADNTVHRYMVNCATAEYEGETAIAVWAIDIEESETQKDQLQAARHSLQAILDAMPAPISIVDHETMRIVYGNENYLKLFGLEALNELHPMYAWDILDPVQPDGTDAVTLSERSILSPESVEIEARSRTVQGKSVDVRILTGIIDYRGRKSTLGIMTDLAREKEYQKTQRNLQAVLDLLPIPIRILDVSDNTLMYANKAALNLFEMQSIEDVLGMDAHVFVSEKQPDGITYAEKLNRLNRGEKFSDEIVCRRADGVEFEALVTACTIDYHGKPASLGIIEDLTAEREYQRMLQSTAEREKEANQLKSRFLVNMSHEIRTPMNAIIGLTDIELRKNPRQEAAGVYRKINTSAKHLLEIINDILDLSKIEADKVELFNDEFELEDVINSALLVATPRLDGKNVEFMLNASLDLPRYVVGDRTRLWQVLKNFLDNSAKYTDEGKIVLSVFPDTRRSDAETVTIRFIIEDTGIGINEEQVRKLFIPYGQFYNEAQKRYTGTGLGMVISKQMCELMGGEMELESAVGEGTKIFIAIPFKRAKNRETELQFVEASALSGVNVLAVDDDEVSLGIIKGLLEGSGAHCESAHSGEEALQTVLKRYDTGRLFDMILLDYMMGGMNGLETAGRIQESLPEAPKLLMVTAYQRLLLKEDIAQNGIYDIIEKPFVPTQFIRKLCAAMGTDSGVDEGEENSFTRFTDVHVLLCEDYILNQEVASGMLEQLGITATIAEDGSQGVELLKSGKHFDLIFMDLQMPVMDGYEAARNIRSDPRFDSIPIISLTADAMREVVDKCLEAGMDDHIAKPIEYAHLHDILMKWLPIEKRAAGDEAVIEASSNEGLARFGNRTDLYEKALREFARILPEQWPAFQSADYNEDEMKRIVHMIKGAAGNLDEKKIYASAIAFENSLRDNTPDKDLYQHFVNECNAYKARISGMTKESQNLPEESGSADELEARLVDLRDALQNYNPKTGVAAVNALKEKMWPQADESKLEQLYDLTLRYEFDSALDILDSMTGGEK